jgi:hypothetical protein
MQEKVLGQRSVEIIGDKSHDRFNPVLLLEFLDRRQRRPLRGRCGASSNAGEPLRVTRIVSPRSTSRASSLRRFFASRMDTVFMGQMEPLIATRSMDKGKIFLLCPLQKSELHLCAHVSQKAKGAPGEARPAIRRAGEEKNWR